MEDLRKTLITPAWAELKQDDSKITKLITHEIFATKNGDIDIEKLILFGLLHCPGSNSRKSETLYGVFQYGGKEKQAFLTANDKDIAPNIENLMRFVTLDLVTLMNDITSIHPMDTEDKAEDFSYIVEEVIEEAFLEYLFGLKSRITYEEYMQVVQTNQKITEVWFKPEMLRAFLFHKLEIKTDDSLTELAKRIDLKI